MHPRAAKAWDDLKRPEVTTATFRRPPIWDLVSDISRIRSLRQSDRVRLAGVSSGIPFAAAFACSSCGLRSNSALVSAHTRLGSASSFASSRLGTTMVFTSAGLPYVAAGDRPLLVHRVDLLQNRSVMARRGPLAQWTRRAARSPDRRPAAAPGQLRGQPQTEPVGQKHQREYAGEKDDQVDLAPRGSGRNTCHSTNNATANATIAAPVLTGPVSRRAGAAGDLFPIRDLPTPSRNLIQACPLGAMTSVD